MNFHIKRSYDVNPSFVTVSRRNERRRNVPNKSSRGEYSHGDGGPADGTCSRPGPAAEGRQPLPGSRFAEAAGGPDEEEVAGAVAYDRRRLPLPVRLPERQDSRLLAVQPVCSSGT